METKIVFDIGGVVINFDPKGYLNLHFPEEDHAARLYNAIFGSAEWGAFDRGDIPFKTAAEIFVNRGREMGLEKEIRQVTNHAFDMLSTRPTMAAMIEQLHGMGVPMYYLSNMSPEVKAMMEKERPFWQLFAGGIASSDVGLLKPDPAFYALLLQRYALCPQDCLFFDDTPQNVDAARAMGLDAYHFTEDAVFVRALAKRGIFVQTGG